MMEGYGVQRDITGKWTARVYIAYRSIWFNFGYKSSRAAENAARLQLKEMKPLRVACPLCGVAAGSECKSLVTGARVAPHQFRMNLEERSR